MTTFHIVLVLLGFLIIGISYILSEKIEGLTNKVSDEKYEKEIVRITAKLQEECQNKSDEILFDAEKKLNQLSNEKILSFTEYSEPLLDKLNQNHTEVVFLYDMLNEKEADIKELVHQVDQTVAVGHDMIAELSKHNTIAKGRIRRKKIEKETEESLDSTAHTSKEDDKEENILEERVIPKQIQNMERVPREEGIEKSEAATNGEEQAEEETMFGPELNDKILEMHRQGIDVRRIAQKLEIGQGEVSLVIGLYQNK